MGKVTRYWLTSAGWRAGEYHADAEMVENPVGGYVLATDYEALEADTRWAMQYVVSLMNNNPALAEYCEHLADYQRAVRWLANRKETT